MENKTDKGEGVDTETREEETKEDDGELDEGVEECLYGWSG
jgi:hypothetical protein